jgi:hypothetical protein
MHKRGAGTPEVKERARPSYVDKYAPQGPIR